MSVKERIIAIRLCEKIKKAPALAKELGVNVNFKAKKEIELFK